MSRGFGAPPKKERDKKAKDAWLEDFSAEVDNIDWKPGEFKDDSEDEIPPLVPAGDDDEDDNDDRQGAGHPALTVLCCPRRPLLADSRRLVFPDFM